METNTKLIVAIVVVVVVVGASAAVIMLPGLLTPPAETMEIGILSPSGVNDFGWTYEMYVSANFIDEAYPDIEIRHFMDMGYNVAELQGVAEDLIDEGFEVIVGHTSGSHWSEMAEDYPDVIFLSAGNPPTNVTNFYGYGSFYGDGFYPLGFLAASISQSGKIGYMDGFQWGSTNAIANAFYWGALLADPSINFTAVWANTWLDMDLARDQAQALIDTGVDIILARTSIPGAIQGVVNNPGTYIFGSQTDQSTLAPDQYLAAVPANNSRLLEYLIKQWLTDPALAGRDLSIGIRGNGTIYFDLSTGGTYIVYNTPLFTNDTIVPASIRAQVLDIEAGVKNGSISITYNETQAWP